MFKIEIGKTYRVSAHTRKSLFEIEMFQHEDKGIRFNVETGYRDGSYLVRIENEDEREELQSTIYIEDKQEEPEIWDSDQFSNQECEDTIDPQGYEYTYHGKGWDEQSSEEMTDEINEALEGDEYFEPKKDWNFKEWASESFGVFHGDALWNIKIRFAKEVAKRAEKVQFHPSQKISHGRNGSLVMELRCRGHRELIWELMHPDWLGFVQIESPDRLKEEYAEQLERAKLAV